MKNVPKHLISIKSTYDQFMGWHRAGDKTSPEPLVTMCRGAVWVNNCMIGPAKLGDSKLVKLVSTYNTW